MFERRDEAARIRSNDAGERLSNSAPFSSFFLSFFFLFHSASASRFQSSDYRFVSTSRHGTHTERSFVDTAVLRDAGWSHRVDPSTPFEVLPSELSRVNYECAVRLSSRSVLVQSSRTRKLRPADRCLTRFRPVIRRE